MSEIDLEVEEKMLFNVVIEAVLNWKDVSIDSLSVDCNDHNDDHWPSMDDF